MKYFTSLPNPRYSLKAHRRSIAPAALMFSLSLSLSPWSRFEDGTVSFLDIIAVNHGFEALYRITGAVTERADP